MKEVAKRVFYIAIILGLFFLFVIAYGNRIEKIDNGEMVQVSESYMK